MNNLINIRVSKIKIGTRHGYKFDYKVSFRSKTVCFDKIKKTKNKILRKYLKFTYLDFWKMVYYIPDNEISFNELISEFKKEINKHFSNVKYKLVKYNFK